jgi:hypothetical protein
MKLHELVILGDDGGIQHHITKAMKNMEHHAAHHTDEAMRELCGEAVKRLKLHTSHPTSLYDDPHTMISILSHMHGEPNVNQLRSAVNTLGSYSQSDSD